MGKNTMIVMNSMVGRAENVLTSEIDGELVMMNIKHGTYFGLDGIGSNIWRLLEKPMTVKKICDLLMEGYHVERDICEKDVCTFLNELIRDDIVQVFGGVHP